MPLTPQLFRFEPEKETMWTILMSNQMEKTIRDKKMIRAPPHMAKKKEGSVNDQADHGKYLKTLTKLFFFFGGVQER